MVVTKKKKDRKNGRERKKEKKSYKSQVAGGMRMRKTTGKNDSSWESASKIILKNI